MRTMLLPRIEYIFRERKRKRVKKTKATTITFGNKNLSNSQKIYIYIIFHSFDIAHTYTHSRFIWLIHTDENGFVVIYIHLTEIGVCVSITKAE